MLKGFFLCAFAVLMLCAGCVVTPLKHQPSGVTPVKIGVLVPVSPESSPQMQRLQTGISFAADELNSGSGVNGRAVELTCRAAGNSLEKANRIFAEFDQAGVAAVILAGSADEVRMVQPLLRQYRMPGIVVLATADCFSEDPELEKWLMRVTFTDTQQGIVLGAFLKYWRNLERAAVLVENSAHASYGRTVAKALREQFEKAGGQIVCSETFDPGKNNDTQLKNLLQADPEAVFIGAADPEVAANWVKALRKAGYQGVLAGPDLWEETEFLKNCSAQPGDCIFTSLYAPDENGENNRNFRQAFRTKCFYYPGDYEAQGYDALKLLCRSIAYSATLEEFQKGLSGLVNYPGAAARYSCPDGELQRSVFLKTLRPSGKERGLAVPRHRLTLTPGNLELFKDKPKKVEEKSIWEEIK